jgi:hypothetical protein
MLKKCIAAVLMFSFSTACFGVESGEQDKWKFVKEKLVDDVKSELGFAQYEFNHTKKAKWATFLLSVLALRGVPTVSSTVKKGVFQGSNFIETKIFKIKPSIVEMPNINDLSGPPINYSVTISDKVFSIFGMVMFFYMLKYYFGTSQYDSESYKDQKILRKFATLNTNVLWHLFSKRVYKKILQAEALKDFVKNWDANKDETPEKLHEFFEEIAKELDTKIYDSSTNKYLQTKVTALEAKLSLHI